MSSVKADIVKEYCLKRPLTRPSMSYKRLLFIMLIFSIATVLLLFLCKSISNAFGNSLYVVCFTIVLSCIFFYYLIKCILILIVKCYQRYASDDLRRSCVCMPTCSEYAIIAIKKYNLFKAVRMIYIRLTKECQGDYHIDFP